MNRRKEDIEKRVEAHLAHLGRFDSPPAEDVVRSRERTFDRLVTRDASTRPAFVHSGRTNWKWRPAVVAAAAVIVIAAVGTAMVWRPVDNTLFRVADGDVHRQGSTVRSNGGGGAVLALTDGSRVEMRSQSELSLERATDGLRIRLMRGGIIVDAAPQRTGHLYVQTKEVTVSVVGTVFLVNADEHGSHVAVIEGEVRVQQGSTEKKLRPGEQVATSPDVAKASIKEEIAWARNAPVLIGLLQQAAQAPVVATPQNPMPAKPAFEVITIRPSANGSPGGGRGGGGLASYAPYRIGCTGFAELDPGRFFIKNVTLLTLIMRAHGPSDRNCTSFTSDTLTGGPAWVSSEQFNIEARIPQGSPVYTVRQFENNNAPVLQAMLQTALADRFKLVLRRGTKELPVEFLRLGTTRDATQLAEMAAATMSRSPRKAEWDGLFARVAQGLETLKEGTVSTEGDGLWGINASVSEMVSYLARLTGKPVLDRTGLTLRFMFHLNYDRVPDDLPGIQGFARPLSPASLTSLRRAFREQLGLELEGGTAPVEVLVIDRVDRPTEN